MAEIRPAISPARGNTFPMVSKASERKICMPPTRSSGRNAMATTTIPIPPNHCVIDRHRRMPSGRCSSPTKTVPPVVVKPDMDSNIASVRLAPVAPSMNGIAPKIGRATQTPVVRMKVC